jgi:hypothetical protein
VDLHLGVLGLIFDDAKEALAAGTIDRCDSHMSRTKLLVDEKGWDELTALLSETLKRVLALQAECAERIGTAGDEAILASVGLTGFQIRLGSGSEADAPAGD